jgi:hypothetical protein
LLVRRDLRELLSPTTITIAGFVWLYAIGYIGLDPLTKASYLSEDGYLKILILALFSTVALWLGEARAHPGSRPLPGIDVRLLGGFGMLSIGVGLLGWAYFLILSGGFFEYYSSMHGWAGAWAETTAYVYAAPNLICAGAAILAWKQSRRRLGFAGRTCLWAAIALLTFDAIVAGSRGHLLRLLLLACIYLMFWRRRQSAPTLLPLVIVGLLPVAFVLVPFLRSATHFGAERSLAEAVQMAVEAVSGLSESGPGHEVVYAAGAVQAAWEQGIMDFGYHWLHPLVNVVPRLWWPDKPYAAEFSIDVPILIWRSHNWFPPPGAAVTGLADAFLRFSWGSPLAWYGIGWVGGLFFRRARERQDVGSVAYFYCYVVGLLHMITQGFNAAVYSSLMIAVPLAVCCGLSRRRSLFGKATA